MITNFLMSRNQPKVQRLAQEDFFKTIKTPNVVTVKETIPESIKRVLGDDFYKLDKVAIIEGIIQNETIFDMKFLKTNTKLLSYMAQSISFIFQGFLGSIGNTVTAEGIAANEARLCVASTSNNYTEVKVTLNDFGPIAEYINGVPLTLKNYKAIEKISHDIQSNEAALRNAPDNESAIKLQKSLNENYQALTDYYVDIISGFFDIVKSHCRIDNLEDIVDISVVFNKTVTGEDGEQINDTSFVQIHSAYNVLYRELQDSLI